MSCWVDTASAGRAMNRRGVKNEVKCARAGSSAPWLNTLKPTHLLSDFLAAEDGRGSWDAVLQPLRSGLIASTYGR
eukprot:762929-Hanusia_phi.AAC.2